MPDDFAAPPSSPPPSPPRVHPPRSVWTRLRRAVSRRLGYLLARMIHAVASNLPYRLRHAAAWIGGTFAYVILRRERSIAFRNLEHAFGTERSARELRRIIRRMFRHFASVYVDWAILRTWPTPRLEQKFPQIAADLRKLETEVRAMGTGAVGLTAHLGNWELLSVFFSRFTPGLVVPIANRIYYPKYHAFLHKLRSEVGLDVIYNDESPRRMIAAIRSGHVIAILPDHEVRTNRSVHVPFFGRPAQTALFPVQLARKLNVPIGLVYLVRENDGYTFIYRGTFDVPRTADEERDLEAATRTWTEKLEEEIRARPEQWVWMHNRWRSPPSRPRRHLDRYLKFE
jgi:KDO2-lipid IV(A) lauroyltransferase